MVYTIFIAVHIIKIELVTHISNKQHILFNNTNFFIPDNSEMKNFYG